ncbi:hypothetical protein J8I87_14985 [Paraburkholderia sp. LEh10]|uniref:hypothetical protein n=1 Tax=Paraburkholderia sp. LEh10 TaxID=2821353 RepID=UPI001AE822A1|nr:hypothetical protein [Paraburkholderia sp. LEh10]MBP0590993.1 hypothetical protein [Paraburkholderia sp. LEh10]
MAAHPRSRHASPLEYLLRFGARPRVLLMPLAIASAVALSPYAQAQAQNDAAQGNGKAAAARGNNAGGANGANGPNGPNGAPPKKTAAQRVQEDSQRLLGGPKTSIDQYGVEGATPDAQRDALMNSERMRVAKPNTQAAGGPVAAGGNGPAQAPAAAKRPPRGGANAPNAADAGGAGAGAAGQRGGAANNTSVGAAAASVYGAPYSNRAGSTLYRSPW